MPKKKTPILDKFNRITEGYPEGEHWGYMGLCSFFDSFPYSTYSKGYNLLYPTEEDFERLEREGKNTGYWASDSYYTLRYQLTDLRLNILFFVMAINNEL